MDGNSWRKGVDESSRVQKRVKESRVLGDRSPGQVKGIMGVRRKLDEFDLGDIFCSISAVMKKEMESVVGKAPTAVQATMKEGMGVLVKAVEETMCRLSDRGRQEEEERKMSERKVIERVEKLEVKVVEAGRKAEKDIVHLEHRVKELEGRVEGGIEKVKGLEEQVEKDMEMVTAQAIKMIIGDSVKEMEEKVKEARCALKVVSLDIGLVTSDKAEIVRKVLESVRRKASRNAAAGVDKVLRRTRVVVLGKETENRKVEGKDLATVPILFQCLDRKDVMVLEDVLRAAGLFPTFYWPDEILEFVGEVKKQVRKEGNTEEDCWIRVRPEEVEGKIRVRVDTKPKAGGRFRLKGVWVCPPLKRRLWEEVEGLYDPVWIDGGEGQEASRS
jgi:hypothetical protein